MWMDSSSLIIWILLYVLNNRALSRRSLYYFLLDVFIYMYMCWEGVVITLCRSQDNFQELALLFHHMDLGTRIQVVRLGSKWFYQLDHVTSSVFSLLPWIFCSSKFLIHWYNFYNKIFLNTNEHVDNFNPVISFQIWLCYNVCIDGCWWANYWITGVLGPIYLFIHKYKFNKLEIWYLTWILEIKSIKYSSFSHFY